MALNTIDTAGYRNNEDTMSSDATRTSFRLLTLNLHKGFNWLNRKFVLHQLRDAVREVSADVVCLQEVLGQHEEHSTHYENWPTAPQYEFLADTIWGEFAYGRNAVYPGGHHGNAVLSKFPIRQHHNFDVSVAGSESRGLLHCTLELPGLDLDTHVVCAHLGLRETHRQHQLQLLGKLADERVPPGAPLIVAGDFNDWRVRAHQPLSREAGLREAFVELHGRAARSFPSRWPMLRLDRVYYRDARIRCANILSDKPWSRLSDHAALCVEVEI